MNDVNNLLEISKILRNNNKPIQDYKLIEEYCNKHKFDIYKFTENYCKFDYPLQYIVGYEYFLGHKIIINENVLIPRMETEEVVLKFCEKIKNKYPIKTNLNILDLCCGSGNITIAIYYELAKLYNLTLHAIDISPKALEVSKKNFEKHKINVNIYKSDIFSQINFEKIKFDCIISNPPYISKKGIIDKNVDDYEPHIALYANDSGLEIYKNIIDNVTNFLNHNNILMFEIGENQAMKIKEYSQVNLKYKKFSIYNDLMKRNRMILIEDIND